MDLGKESEKAGDMQDVFGSKQRSLQTGINIGNQGKEDKIIWMITGIFFWQKPRNICKI
jgi:hypothetical protein